jgi:hypothetical protein
MSSKKTKTSCEEDVLSLVDEEIESLSKRKGKKSSSNAKTTPSTSRTSSSSKTQGKSTGNADNSELLNILKSIQVNQKKQDDTLNSLTGKVNELYDDDDEHDEYDENNDNEDQYEPPAKKSKSDENNNTTQGVSKDSEQSGEVSRFATMSKRFKQKEITGDKIDETLASNITDLFRNGMDEAQYSEIIKDEVNHRPDNCDGSLVVKTNQLIWELISPFA